MLLYKKSTLGRKYTRLVTGSSWLFFVFIILGICLFVALTVSFKVDVIKTYKAEIIKTDQESSLRINSVNISMGTAFIYSNRNKAVYPVQIEKVEIINDSSVLQFTKTSQEIIKSMVDEDVYLDIVQGKETLLYRIVVRGGKSNG